MGIKFRDGILAGYLCATQRSESDHIGIQNNRSDQSPNLLSMKLNLFLPFRDERERLQVILDPIIVPKPSAVLEILNARKDRD
jgi:hypothetical protein